MSYQEIIKRALHGRSVNAAAKQWGIPQSTLDKYAKGDRLPDHLTAKIIMKEAGISAEEMMDTLAEEEEKRRSKTVNITKSFKALLHNAKRYWTRVPAAV